MLSVDTDVNGDSKRTNEKGPSLVGFLGLSCQYKRALAALVGQGQKNVFPHRTLNISIPLSTSPSKLGRKSCWVACIIVCVS
jgi:hypothetical protein